MINPYPDDSTSPVAKTQELRTPLLRVSLLFFPNFSRVKPRVEGAIFSGDLEKKKFCLRPEETVSDWHISHDHLGHAKA